MKTLLVLILSIFTLSGCMTTGKEARLFDETSKLQAKFSILDHLAIAKYGVDFKTAQATKSPQEIQQIEEKRNDISSRDKLLLKLKDDYAKVEDELKNRFNLYNV